MARADDPRLHLLVVGDGEWRARVRGDARGSRACTSSASATTTALPEALRAADFLLLPSDLDSFSLALLEGLACGLPAVDHRPGGRAARC